MGWLKRWNDTFGAAEQLECGKGLDIGHVVIPHAANFLKPAMFGADARIIQASGDRMRLGDLAVCILQQIGFVAVEDAGATARQRRGMFLVETVTRRFNAQHCHVFVVKKRVEQP